MEEEAEVEVEAEHLCSSADTMPSIADVFPVPGGPWTESWNREYRYQLETEISTEGRREEGRE
jgi:hypothetical protein